MSDDAPATTNPAEQRVLELGQTQWKTKKEGADWNGWVHIGQALDVGRSHAMRITHTNRPTGRGYNEAFSLWLKRTGFDDMDKVLRAALLECVNNLIAIEQWRKTLAASQRFEWNNPRTVLKRWRASTTVPAKQNAPAPSPVAALKARIVELEEELHRLKKAEDEGGVTLSRHDSAGDSVKAIRDMYRQQASKLRTLAHGLLREADSIEGKEERAKKK